MRTLLLKPAYIISDVITSQLAWTVFFFFRKMVIEQQIFGPNLNISADKRLFLGLIIIPAFWVVLNFLTGFYNNPLRKSRLSDLGMTFLISLCGTIVLFFALILDDTIIRYTNYYLSFAVLFLLQFIISYIPRFIITTGTVHRVHAGKIGFNTIIIGANGRALEVFNRISAQAKSTGNIFVGYLSPTSQKNSLLDQYMDNLGSTDNVNQIIETHNVEEIIIAIEPEEHNSIGEIISALRNTRIIIKAIPGNQDLLMGRVKMSSIFGTPLILINTGSMPVWQYNIKRVIDYFTAIIMLIILSPISLCLAMLIKIGSKGPVIFSQERIGRSGKKFRIYKFRSMRFDAEIDGPALSGIDDDRITKLGKYMRKHRLDEIPNFINVIKGEMSIVGPRPEREYFINQILEKAPHYHQLLKVKPGITSWGQVKYGYASNIDEILERLEYDLLYLDNMSLYVDFKIIIYTFITIIKGKGL